MDKEKRKQIHDLVDQIIDLIDSETISIKKNINIEDNISKQLKDLQTLVLQLESKNHNNSISISLNLKSLFKQNQNKIHYQIQLFTDPLVQDGQCDA